MRRLLLSSALLVACAKPAPAPPPKKVDAPQAAACIEKEIAIQGRSPDVVRYLLDASGNVLSSEDIHGDTFIGFRRARTGHMLSYEVTHGKSTATGTFSYGSRGELAAVRLTSSNGSLDIAAELDWSGTFKKSKGVTLPFAPLGGAGGAMYSHAVQILSSNLNVRHGSNPMPPVSFTGTVTVTKVQGPTETYAYEGGRLQRRQDDRGSEASYRWDEGALPVEESWCTVDGLSSEPSCGSATRSTLPSGDEHVVIGGSGSAIVMDYDAAGREVVAYGGPLGVEKARWHGCESFKPLRSR